MNTPIKDAFNSLQKQGNEKAQTMVTQAVQYRPSPVGERIRTLKNLVYDTFVKNIPRNAVRRRDIYDSARERVRELGIQGGEEYQTALMLVHDAWKSSESWREAARFITNADAYEIAVATRAKADPEQEELARRIIAKMKRDAGIMVRS